MDLHEQCLSLQIRASSQFFGGYRLIEILPNNETCLLYTVLYTALYSIYTVYYIQFISNLYA